jgi:hypothetical protein
MKRRITSGMKSQELGPLTDYHLAAGAALGLLPSVAVR